MLTKIEGAFGIVALHKDHKQILCARKGSPLVLGVNNGEFFIASDPSPFLEYTKEVIYLNEKQMASIEETGYKIKDFNGFNIEMEKENIKRIIFVSCGTSYYASLVGKYILEKSSHIPVVVEYASEFRYRHPMLYPTDLVIAVSQSGETADTLEAIRLAKKLSCSVAGIVNVTGSSIAKECGQGIYVHAGPEIGVASTKAFTSQIIAMNLLNVYLNKDPHYRVEVVEELKNLPEKIQFFLKNQTIINIAKKYVNAKYFLFMGRDINYPV